LTDSRKMTTSTCFVAWVSFRRTIDRCPKRTRTFSSVIKDGLCFRSKHAKIGTNWCRWMVWGILNLNAGNMVGSPSLARPCILAISCRRASCDYRVTCAAIFSAFQAYHIFVAGSLSMYKRSIAAIDKFYSLKTITTTVRLYPQAGQ